MYVQLTVDIGDRDPRDIAAVLDAMAPAASAATAAGHTLNLNVVDAIGPYDPDDSSAQAEARGFGAGYSTGFDAGFQVGFNSRGLDSVDQATGAGLLKLPDTMVQRGGRTPDDDENGPGASAHNAHETDLHVALVDAMNKPGGRLLTSSEAPWAFYTDTMNLPATAPVPPVSAGPLWVDDENGPATGVLPIPGPFTKMFMESQRPPEGPRPSPGPGAPISAYDMLSRSSAAGFGFPADPRQDDLHTDTEGADWRFGPVDWQRTSYPSEWGPAPSGAFPEIHIER